MNRFDNYSALRANNIQVFDDFISSKKCTEILYLISESAWVPATVGRLSGRHKYQQFYTSARTNWTLHSGNFSNDLHKKVKWIEDKIVVKTNLNVNRLEDWQISKFEYGQEFEFHNDCGCWSQDAAGEREKTILLYLTTPAKGGETCFRALNLLVRAVQGRLVVWDNLLSNGHCNYSLIHGALPIRQGIKVTLNSWVRQADFRRRKGQ